MWNNNNNTPGPMVDVVFRNDFQLIVPLPEKNSLAREIRFYMSYFQSNRLLQSSKWYNYNNFNCNYRLGELLITISH